MAAALLRNATIAANASLAGDASGGIEPSPLTCIGLSAFGGFLEVASTMCLAYPEYLEKLGTVYSKCRKRAMMALNLALMGVASVAYIVGSWYGPVSLSVRRHGLEVAADGRGAPHGQILKGPAGGPNPGLLPTRCPLSQTIALESLRRQVGTYCIACAILTLPDVGPSDQPDLDVLWLVQQ